MLWVLAALVWAFSLYVTYKLACGYAIMVGAEVCKVIRPDFDRLSMEQNLTQESVVQIIKDHYPEQYTEWENSKKEKEALPN